MLFNSPPPGFKPKFAVVSCFCESGGEILLLQRQPWKPQGGQLGVPAGKKDPQDLTIEAAIKRETWEETGINLTDEGLSYFGEFFVRYADFDFVYHIFHHLFSDKPSVQLRQTEHQKFFWVTPRQALHMDLIPDLDACIKLFFHISQP